MSTLPRAGQPRRRTVAAWLILTLGVLTAPSVNAAPCWFPPVDGTVIDPFRKPACPWCAGNRGLEFVVGPDTAVRAAASGRVEFVGSVAGVLYVVVRLAGGWRHTYGHLESTSLVQGGVAVAGTHVGRASATFFFGLRIDGDYTDPAPNIGVLHSRPRLVPTDGTSRRPGAAPLPRCVAPSPPAQPGYGRAGERRF